MTLIDSDKARIISRNYSNQDFEAHATLQISFDLPDGTWMVTAGVTLDQDEARAVNDYIMFCLSTEPFESTYNEIADTFGVTKLRMSEGGNAFGTTTVPVGFTGIGTVFFRLRSDFTCESDALKVQIRAIKVK